MKCVSRSRAQMVRLRRVSKFKRGKPGSCRGRVPLFCVWCLPSHTFLHILPYHVKGSIAYPYKHWIVLLFWSSSLSARFFPSILPGLINHFFLDLETVSQKLASHSDRAWGTYPPHNTACFLLFIISSSKG